MAHVAGGLTSTIANLQQGRKLVEHQVDCLGIGDMVDPDPAALDATVLKIGAGNKDQAEGYSKDEGAGLE